jgi:hypothetical protein
MLPQTVFSIDACTLWAYLSAARYFHVSRKVVDDQGHVKMGFEQVLAVIATLPQKGKTRHITISLAAAEVLLLSRLGQIMAAVCPKMELTTQVSPALKLPIRIAGCAGN